MKREHFDFYGYNAPTWGGYYHDGVTYFLGEDFRSVKRYKEYKDIGFNMCLLQHDNGYNGEKWETCSTKKCMDVCQKVGLDRVIVEDKRLKELCKEPLLVGEGGKFKTEDELMAYLDECTKPYRDHPCFYAIQLEDEPIYKYLKEYAHVYRALKKLLPKAELQCNLLNMILHSQIAPDPNNLQTMDKDLADYLRYFVKESGIDYIMTDEYAFRGRNRVSPWTVPTFQVFANVAKELGIEARMVLQSFSQEACVTNKEKPGFLEGSVAWRRITEKDMYWQMNLALGLGFKEFSFFTYLTKAVKNFRGKWVGGAAIDGAALLNYDGTRTRLWYATQKVIREVKAFEPVIIKYNYDNAYFFFPEGKDQKSFDSSAEALLSDVKNIPISVKTPKYPVMVSEMRNGKSRMYMVQNIGNPIEELMYNKKATVLDIDLGELAGKAKFYYKGKQVERQLDGTILKEKLGIGQAIFIEVE
ncbi:MAG: hypothetical protein E7382_03105 [Clostridiales bacterium]|nr:hypothetical protein [Clostridiales bacterium]